MFHNILMIKCCKWQHKITLKIELKRRKYGWVFWGFFLGMVRVFWYDFQGKSRKVSRQIFKQFKLPRLPIKSSSQAKNFHHYFPSHPFVEKKFINENVILNGKIFIMGIIKLYQRIPLFVCSTQYDPFENFHGCKNI